MKAATLSGASGAIILGVIKETRGNDLIVLNQNFVFVQVICFGIMFVALTGVLSAWCWRVVDCHRRGMIWSAKRQKTVQVCKMRLCPICR